MVRRVERERTQISEIGILIRRGFTLLELFVVLLIISTFLTLVTVRIEKTISRGDLSESVRILVRGIQGSRSRALFSREKQYLYLKIESGEYLIRGESQKQPYKGSLPDGVIIQDVLFPLKGKVMEGEAEIVFLPNGCTERVLIHLENSEGNNLTLKVDPFTADVKVQEGYIEEAVL